MKTTGLDKKTVVRICLFAIVVLLCILSFSCDTKKKVRVAIVKHMSHTSLNQINETIVADLQKEFGDTVTIIQKNANGTISNLAEIYAGLIAVGGDYVIPIATPTAIQAKSAFADAGRHTPIIFSACSAPIASGLVASLEEAPQTITGVVNMIPADKIINMALQIQPQLKRIGIINNTGESNSVASVELAKKHLDSLGISYVQKTIMLRPEIRTEKA